MKKTFLIAGVLLIFCLSATMILNQSRASVLTPTVNTGLPEDVQKIVANSCSPCHFEGGGGMALSNVNFSEWENYTVQKQSKKSGAICKAILDHSMPPANFSKSNPDKVPTKEQAEVICKWAETLVYKK